MNYVMPESDILKRLSWGKAIQNLMECNHVNHTKPIVSSGKKDTGYKVVLSESDPIEVALGAETVDNLSQILEAANVRALGWSRLVVPHRLLERIGQELLHLAATEPCGLRGALIDLCVEKGNTHQNVGQISVDSFTVPTFHLTFLLRPDLGGLWPKLTSKLNNSVRLSTGFTVVKRKFYSSDEVHIEEL